MATRSQNEKSAKASKKQSAYPAEFRELLNQRPTISGESEEEYDRLLANLAEALGPSDVIEWLSVKDIADITWEILRLRRCRKKLIEALPLETLAKKIEEDKNDFIMSEVEVDAVRNGGAPGLLMEQVRRRLLVGDDETIAKYLGDYEPELDEERILAEALLDVIETLQPLDQIIASMDARRDGVLREIERRRERVAQRLRTMTDQLLNREFNHRSLENPNQAAEQPR